MVSPPPQPEKGRDGAIQALDLFIQILDTAKNACGIPPAQVAFGSACVLLTMIRVSRPLSAKPGFSHTSVQNTMANSQDYAELGEECGKVCKALYGRLKGRQPDELNQHILDAIGDLTM